MGLDYILIPNFSLFVPQTERTNRPKHISGKIHTWSWNDIDVLSLFRDFSFTHKGQNQHNFRKILTINYEGIIVAT